MLEYVKLVLQKVRFNDVLFRKELSKSLRWLDDHEKKDLQHWIRQKFGSVYQEIFSDAEAEEIFQ